MSKKNSETVSNVYEDWFLDYASYVILERAVPQIEDGLKPVQRRLLHAMKKMDDGRFHKVANIIGQTMQYHPHGDAAIGDALINLGQKDLLIETQGNWGDVRTGDKAAAPRYIEARLSSFALEVSFNNDITNWQISYDGRKKEPIFLPMKFPLLLAQGVEGIAVGLSTKIMPHNFIELIKSSISILKDNPFKIFPDFQTGGIADFSNYNQGKKGGKIRLRSIIETKDKKTLIIKTIPYSVSTSSLIDSIIKANENGKIKIKKVEDNTAEKIEIVVHLTLGVSPQVTIDALYAFTNCEISLSPNCCVIVDNKPNFISVNKMLRICTENTVQLLKKELELLKNKLLEKWHFATLEKIFIENKIYRQIEECETWESILKTIDKALIPYKNILKNQITKDDIGRLTEIKIKRISKFNSNKANDDIASLENDIKEVNTNLNNIIIYSIKYFESILKKYSKGRERKTEISNFDSISARRVVIANKKLYVNKKEGFIGYNLKKDEFISDCSDIDNIIVFLKSGKYKVVKIEPKLFIGKNIIHASIWKKNEKHMIYNVIYFQGLSKISYVKRFAVTSVVKDREYDITSGDKNNKLLYFTANPNSESEIVSITLDSKAKTRNKSFDFDFSSILIKGRNSKGNILSKHPIKRVVQKSRGESTLGGRDIWIDKTIGRLNDSNQGTFLGKFNSDEIIISYYSDGTYEKTRVDFSNRYNFNEIVHIKKFDPEKAVCVVYYNGKQKAYYIKKFNIETSVIDKKYKFISDERGSKLVLVSFSLESNLGFNYRTKKGEKKSKLIDLSTFVSIKGWQALGNKIKSYKHMSGFKIIETKNQKETEGLDNENKENNQEDVSSVSQEKLNLF